MSSSDRLMSVFQRLRNIRLMDVNLQQVEITLPQMDLMMYIMHTGGEGCRIQDIAEGMGLSAPTVSVAVKKLEDQGWLIKKPDPGDRRASIVTLSGKSIKIIKTVKDHQRMATELLLGGISIEEQQQLIELLDRVVSFAENQKNAIQ